MSRFLAATQRLGFAAFEARALVGVVWAFATLQFVPPPDWLAAAVASVRERCASMRCCMLRAVLWVSWMLACSWLRHLCRHAAAGRWPWLRGAVYHKCILIQDDT